MPYQLFMTLPGAADPPEELKLVSGFVLLMAQHLKAMSFKVRAQLWFSVFVQNTNHLIVLFFPRSIDPGFYSRKKPKDDKGGAKQIYCQKVKATSNSHAQSGCKPNCRGGGNANDPAPIAQNNSGAQKTDTADNSSGDTRIFCVRNFPR
jgi:hypothetical protein